MLRENCATVSESMFSIQLYLFQNNSNMFSISDYDTVTFIINRLEISITFYIELFSFVPLILKNHFHFKLLPVFIEEKTSPDEAVRSLRAKFNNI